MIPDSPGELERVWPSAPPADCPLPPSVDFQGVAFTGQHVSYTKADTWYPAWAADGALYSCYTDGTVADQPYVHSRDPKWGGRSPQACVGMARIDGDDPLQLRIEPLTILTASPEPYGGRYPCGNLAHQGVWYAGTYCLDELLTPEGKKDPRQNWGILGPFIGWRYSTDGGRNWVETPHTPTQPLFSESGKAGRAVRFGAPKFVDFGRDMQHSPDGHAYLAAHGSTQRGDDRRAIPSWITGDHIYLARVRPSIATINNPAAYEFYGGTDQHGEPQWTRVLAQMRPLIDWPGRCGCVTVTYHPGIRRYLACVTDGGTTLGPMDTWIAEASHITGPWRLVSYLKAFGSQAYFVNIPSKFLSADGPIGWLCYSANYSHKVAANPPGSSYALCLQQFELKH